MRDLAAGDGEAVERCLAVEDAPGDATLNARAPGARVQPHALHRHEIDDEPVVADQVARDAVAAAADSESQAALTTEAHRLDDVGNARAARDAERPAIESAVPHATRLVVVITFGADQPSPEAGLQVGQVDRHCMLHLHPSSVVGTARS